jgi:hypothetical protein
MRNSAKRFLRGKANGNLGNKKLNKSNSIESNINRLVWVEEGI